MVCFFNSLSSIAMAWPHILLLAKNAALLICALTLNGFTLKNQRKPAKNTKATPATTFLFLTNSRWTRWRLPRGASLDAAFGILGMVKLMAYPTIKNAK